MRDAKRERLQATVLALEQRFGPRVLVAAREAAPPPPVIPTGFAALDDILGIGGVPRSALTLLSGQGTAGKLTLAYKVLSHAQWPAPSAKTQRLRPVAIVDTSTSADADYLMRCGVDLAHLLIIRPQSGRQAVEVLLDLVQNRALRAILVDNLPDILSEPDGARYLEAVLPQLHQRLHQASCALMLVQDMRPSWQRWLPLGSQAVHRTAALHLDLQHERWLERADALMGYQAQVRVVRNRWGRTGQVASIAVEFNGIVRARPTW